MKSDHLVPEAISWNTPSPRELTELWNYFHGIPVSAAESIIPTVPTSSAVGKSTTEMVQDGGRTENKDKGLDTELQLTLPGSHVQSRDNVAVVPTQTPILTLSSTESSSSTPSSPTTETSTEDSEMAEWEATHKLFVYFEGLFTKLDYIDFL